MTRDKFVHVSYRQGDQIFWTNNKVLLRQGETILTDGTTRIRARCGNCISEQPLLPTSDSEPDVVEFDRLVDETPSSPVTAPVAALVRPMTTAPGGTGAPALAAAETGGPLAAAQPGVGGPAMPLALGRTGVGGPIALASSTPSAGVAGRESPPIVGTPSPFGLDPFVPGDDLVPGTQLFAVPGTQVFPEPTPFGIGGDPPSPGMPANPVPVPEPGTLLLVGTGVAAMIQRLRSRARQRASGD